MINRESYGRLIRSNKQNKLILHVLAELAICIAGEEAKAAKVSLQPLLPVIQDNE
jgi:hypothetical protein